MSATPDSNLQAMRLCTNYCRLDMGFMQGSNDSEWPRCCWGQKSTVVDVCQQNRLERGAGSGIDGFRNGVRGKAIIWKAL